MRKTAQTAKTKTANRTKAGKKAKTGTSPRNSAKSIKSKKTVAAPETMPASLNIRSYQVGFGDCFLLTFNYPDAKKADDRARHLLMDFGSTGLPPGTPSDQMMRVAQDIKNQCGEKLHIVVATHRHKDHISGFTTQDNKKGTGDIIAALTPEVVIQPWTEDPEAHDPTVNITKVRREGSKALAPNEAKALQISSLTAMNSISEALLAEVRHISDERKFRKPLSAGVAEQIKFLADDNTLPNKSAVENLRKMGKKNFYVSHGSKLELSKLLPGVSVSVLGPPTLEQHAEIEKERSSDKDEFWMLRAAAQEFWGQQAATGKMLEKFTSSKGLFPNADVIDRVIPPYNKWFIRQIRAMRGEQMLGLVRILDKAMNNTSVILLFDIGGKKLLFPGDAQIENWEYALSIAEDVEQLKDVEVYKVGHHGSRNATPKTLWNNFEHKGEKANDKDRLTTVVSTMEGKHGSRSNHSEVPRQTLVDALSSLSDYHTTQTAAEENALFEDILITF